MLFALPQSPESWAFLMMAFPIFAGGVGFLVSRVWDRKLATANRAADTAADTAKALADTQQRLIDAAERREIEANKRMDAALAGVAQLSAVTSELTAVNKSMLEETRRANTNVESLARELQFSRRQAPWRSE